MEIFSNIIGIINTILGDPKRDYAGSGGWYEYNCPHCADENGGIPDNKYNLALTYNNSQWFHCWRCGYSGKLSRLIRDYGTRDQLNEYRAELSAIRGRLKYMLQSEGIIVSDDFSDMIELMLPEGFRPIKEGDRFTIPAYEYLKKRGITDNIIKRYNIGCVPYGSGDDRNMMCRVVIPSYDEFGTLNYWVGRDYTGKSFMKYKNVNIEKKTVVFNEAHINWYEPVTLVEGPFDHIVVPNSIPLLGKTLDYDYEVFTKLIHKSHSYINIFLDPDARDNALSIYKLLNSTMLNGRIKLIDIHGDYDASDIYRAYGHTVMLKMLASARRLTPFDFIDKF